ncbi:MAG: hypothetical protein KME30_00010 [Iphinoe sp. HA4291-MV1]|jgi:lipopolysaccharide transport system ATP-binding protein|nr:hypothetical protein [Iphinoe sp. HA4291-MV1]
MSVGLDLRLTDGIGNPVGFGSLGTLNAKHLIKLKLGINTISFRMPINQLAIGKYFISLDLAKPDVEYYDKIENCLAFEVTRPPEEGGIVVLSQTWGFGCFEINLEAISH